MRKRNVVAFIVGIVLCLGLVFIVTHPDRLDDAILLEKQHPGYWKYLSPDAAVTRTVPSAFFEGDDSVNLLNPAWRNVTSQGVTATLNSDGSVTVKGSNTGSGFNLTTTGIDLPAGSYVYTNNKAGGSFDSVPGCWMYVWQGNTASTVSTLPELEIIDGESYHTGIHIDEGAGDIDVTFYPMIRVKDRTGEYEPADFNNMITVNDYNVDESVGVDDVKIFLRQAENSQSASVITFPDNESFQIYEGKITKGIVNSFGFIKDGAKSSEDE